MKYTNTLGLPDAIVQAVIAFDSMYDGGQSDITVTSMIGSPRKRILTKRYWDSIEVDIADRLFALQGGAIHLVLEQQHVSDLQEVRLHARYNGWSWSGKLDNYVLIDGILQDYKHTSVWPFMFGGKDEWEAQCNLNCYLLIENGYNVRQLQIVGLLRDWSASKFLQQQGNGYPPKPMIVYPVKMWSKEQVETYIHSRITAHQKAEQGPVLPDCTYEERWASERTIAVMKGENKTATKLFTGDNADEMAAEFINLHKDGGKMKAVERPSVYRRCEQYCDVAPFCDQWAELKEAK